MSPLESGTPGAIGELDGFPTWERRRGFERGTRYQYVGEIGPVSAELRAELSQWRGTDFHGDFHGDFHVDVFAEPRHGGGVFRTKFRTKFHPSTAPNPHKNET